MIIVVKRDSTQEQIDHIVALIHGMGLRTDVSRGIKRTIIGVIGEEDAVRNAPLAAIPGVEEVVPILKPFKLASRDYQAEDSVVDVGFGVKVGGGSLAMIAGPCAIEGREILFDIARQVKAAGANILRGGAYKPRTSPYSFQGLGEEGLSILREALVDKYADILQIGARNMQNFNLLSEVGQTKRPVLLKRGMSATVTDLLMSAEYILAQGNKRVILCERGVRSFDSSTRNLLDLSIVPNARGQSHLPIIVDPSHATGRPDLIPAMSLAAVAAGADGVHIEVHSCPEKALSDGPQALLPDQYAAVMGQMRQVAGILQRTIPAPRGK